MARISTVSGKLPGGAIGIARTGGAFGIATPVVSGRSVSFMPSPSVGTVAPRGTQPYGGGVPPVFTGGRASFGPTALPSVSNLNQNFIGPKH
jgi:hypothetical protein